MPNLASIIREAEKIRAEMRRQQPPLGLRLEAGDNASEPMPVPAVMALAPVAAPAESTAASSAAAPGTSLAEPPSPASNGGSPHPLRPPAEDREPSGQVPEPEPSAVESQSAEPQEILLTFEQLEALKEALSGFDKEVMTASELAHYLKVGRSYVLTNAHRGLLPGTKLAGRWRFKRSLIDQWLEERIAGPGRQQSVDSSQ